MPRSAHFSASELAEVLSHYNTGVIRGAESLPAGNKRAPKVVITAERGRFLLKRRPHGVQDIDRIRFAHAVQLDLSGKSFPVTGLVRTADGDSTVLQLGDSIYELFKFVSGSRYDGSAEATIEAGQQLAHLHMSLADFDVSGAPGGAGWHDSGDVRLHLKVVGRGGTVSADGRLRRTAEDLMTMYNASGIRVNQLGFDSWPAQVVHGDWHPGNMLFERGRLAAVLDFDLVKVAPAVIDLANGMLQFSIVANRPNPARWPDYLDQAKLVQFLSGYRCVIQPDRKRVAALPDLMIETLIAEAVLPIAATGYFGNLSGGVFLAMIQRKSRWIDVHRDKLLKAMDTA
jgi:homoserine kinase type II